MTPLEKAVADNGRVNYCDECESFVILNNAPYCKVDGKLIHPIMFVRGQGTGPAWNCKKRKKPLTNYDLLIRKTPQELAEFIGRDPMRDICPNNCHDDPERPCKVCALDWLKKEVSE